MTNDQKATNDELREGTAYARGVLRATEYTDKLEAKITEQAAELKEWETDFVKLLDEQEVAKSRGRDGHLSSSESSPASRRL